MRSCNLETFLRRTLTVTVTLTPIASPRGAFAPKNCIKQMDALFTLILGHCPKFSSFSDASPLELQFLGAKAPLGLATGSQCQCQCQSRKSFKLQDLASYD